MDAVADIHIHNGVWNRLAVFYTSNRQVKLIPLLSIYFILLAILKLIPYRIPQTDLSDLIKLYCIDAIKDVESLKKFRVLTTSSETKTKNLDGFRTQFHDHLFMKNYWFHLYCFNWKFIYTWLQIFSQEANLHIKISNT